jgi:hypothetical protein
MHINAILSLVLKKHNSIFKFLPKKIPHHFKPILLHNMNKHDETQKIEMTRVDEDSFMWECPTMGRSNSQGEEERSTVAMSTISLVWVLGGVLESFKW